ncbi:MAG: nucleotidyltransferase domain-containing protein [Bacteroidetes bacterium]|nr:MAG: nucleotidyltransferase domain-containing protein [Bacteroidota bacterium]
MFGLTKRDIEQIIAILHQYTEVDEAYIFGSRAKGNYNTGSDVDIALKGKGLTADMITRLNYLLNEETLMPYYFDVIHYDCIGNKALREHIDRVGEKLFNQRH